MKLALICLCLCSIPYLSEANNFIVNASLTTASGNSYPNLLAAIKALYSGTRLTNTVNTITLLPNCIGVPQTITNQTISGSRVGSITIQYQSPPNSVSNASTCSQLPVLNLSSNSYLSVTSFSSFSLIGLSIQYTYASSYSNVLQQIGTFNMSYSCFNLTDPTLTSAVNNYYFTFNTVTTVIISNSYFAHDGTKMLYFYNCGAVNVTNTLIYLWNSPSNSVHSALGADLSSYYATNFTVSNIQITCNSSSIVLPSVILASNIFSAYYSNISVANCDLRGTTTTQGCLIGSQNSNYSTFDGITFTNIVFGSNNYQALLCVINNQNVTISNIQMTSLQGNNTNSSNLNYMIFIESILGSSYSPPGMHLLISNILINNSTLETEYCLFYIEVYGPDYLAGLTIYNFTINNTNMLQYSAAFKIYLFSESNITVPVTPTTLYVSNLNIVNCNFTINTPVNVHYYAYSGDVQAVEVFHIEYQDIYIANNFLNSSVFFENEGLMVQYVNMTACNNTLTQLATFITSYYYVMSVYVMNSTFENISILSYSALIINDNLMANFYYFNELTARSKNVEYAFQANNSFMYAETRPFILYNCTFSNIEVQNSSVVVSAANPQTIVQNCTFRNFTLSNTSELLQMGGYTLYINELSLFYPSAALNYPPTITNFAFFSYAENAVLSNNPNAQALFYAARNQTSLYDPSNCAYFIFIQGNVIDQVATYNSDSLIDLNDFNIPNGSIVICNNSLSNITGSSDVDFPIISSNSVPRAFIIGNVFTDLNILGYVFSLQASILSTFFFDSNSMTDSFKAGAYLFTADECDNITIQGMTASDLETENDFISMTCDVIDTQLVLANSSFQNILQTSNQGKSLAVYFISIGTQNFSNTSLGEIIIQNNTFQNITLSRDKGYTTETAETSFLSIFMTQSSTTIANNSLYLINITDGNIMAISAPTLKIQDTNYSSVYFGDSNGALSLIFQNLTLLRSNFENSLSLNHIGAGLIKLTTPDLSSIALAVNVSECSFKNNQAAYGAVFYATSAQVNFQMKDSIVSDNIVNVNGGVFYFYESFNSTINLTNTTFTLNQNQQTGYPNLYLIEMESTSNTTVIVSGSTFEAAGSILGTFLYATDSQNFQLNLSNFTFTSLTSGSYFNATTGLSMGILTTDDVEAYLVGVNVINITNYGSPLIVLNCDTEFFDISQKWKLSISQSTFECLNLSEGIVIINSDEYIEEPLNNLSLTIDNSTFLNISWKSAGSGGGGIIASTTKLIGNDDCSGDHSIEITNSHFLNLIGTQTSTVYMGMESFYYNILLVDNNVFQSITVLNSPGAVFNPSFIMLGSAISLAAYQNCTGDETIKVINNQFSGITAQQGGVLAWTSIKKDITLLFNNNSFEDVGAVEDGGVFYLNYIAPSHSQDTTVINIYNCSFSGIYAQNGGVVQAIGSSNLLEVYLNTSSVINVTVTENGAIMNFPNSSSNTISASRLLSSSSTGIVLLENTTFTDITATNGGILYELTPNQTMNISIHNNWFTNINAYSRGGLVYVNQPFLALASNNVTATTAGIAGTILYANSDNLGLINSQNVFVGDNPSSAYAFSPTNLLIQVIDLSDSSTVTLQNYDATLSTNPTLPNLTSYSLSQYELVFTLVYAGRYGTQIVTDTSKNTQVNLEFITPGSNTSNQSFISQNCSDSVCSVTASTVTLAGEAGDVYTVNVTYQSSTFTQFQQFYIRLRACQPGELNQTSTATCSPCPPGSYSLNTSDSTCLDCPTGADCQGGENIFIEPGYYRSANTTGLYIIFCNDGDSVCLGGRINTCDQGYTGPLCAQCDYNAKYFPNSNGECGICTLDTATYVRGIILLTLGIAYQIYLITSSFKKNQKTHREKTERRKSILLGLIAADEPEKLGPGQLMIIFTAFTQIFAVLASFELGSVSQVLEASQTITNPNKIVLSSVNCMLYAKTSSPLNELQLEILFYIFSPIVKIIVVALLEVIRMIITRCHEKKIHAFVRLGTVAVVLTMLEQPNIIGALTNYLSCSQLDPYVSDEYVKLPNTVQCYTPEYYYFRNVAVIPGFVFWGALVPSILFYVLYKKRHDLEVSEKSKHLFTVMGHLYSGYTTKSFYWGVLIIFFKMLMFTLSSVLIVSDNIKCVIYLVVIQLYYELLTGRPPYTNKILYKAEKYCINAYRITLILIMLKLGEISINGFDTICEVLILIAAIYGAAYTLWHVVRLYMVAVKEWIQLLKEKAKDNKLLALTLDVLREHHIDNDGGRFKRNRRRDAICVDRPYPNPKPKIEGTINLLIRDSEEIRVKNDNVSKANLIELSPFQSFKSDDNTRRVDYSPTKQDDIRPTETIYLNTNYLSSPRQFDVSQSDVGEIIFSEPNELSPTMRMLSKKSKVLKLKPQESKSFK